MIASSQYELTVICFHKIYHGVSIMITDNLSRYKHQGFLYFVLLIITIIPIFIVFSLLFTANVNAASVSLEWDANSESDLAGYKIYWSSTSGSYTNINSILVNKDQTSATVTGLLSETTYYFVATAYDNDGYESDYSDEVRKETGSVSSGINTNSDGGSCFIATAAYGSNMEDAVMF